MNIITTTDQAECLACLAELGILEVFQPRPPQVVSDSILQLDADTWLIGTNDRGQYALAMLTEATKAEAWAVFDNIRGPGTKYSSPRLEFCGAANKPDCN